MSEQQILNSASKRQKKEHAKHDAKKGQPSPMPKHKVSTEVQGNGNGHAHVASALNETRNPTADLFQTTEVDRSAYRPHKN